VIAPDIALKRGARFEQGVFAALPMQRHVPIRPDRLLGDSVAGPERAAAYLERDAHLRTEAPMKKTKNPARLS
jgi:hypothetical protein